MATNPVTFRTFIKLILASLVVGLVLAGLGITPADLADRAIGLASSLWQLSRDVLGWAGSYILLGALVVLPIWLVRLLWRRANR